MYDLIQKAVDKHRDMILKTERFVWEHPETGYKEYETSKYLENIFISLGYELTYPEGITGFITTLDTGRPGPAVLILGELDSIICPAHKDANPETGAVHSCGHNAQCAALAGVAAALKEPGMTDELCGKIMLCAVPAEELLEIEFRSELKKQGKIKYFGGKSEFLYRGLFDEADIAFMVHTSGDYCVNKGNVGCLAKKITFKGRAAHAGGNPWDGCNALYAAACGLNAVNAIRETFKEDDIIRVHPIMTKGGDMVNAIPEQASLESYVRGKTFDAIKKANYKVNRALCGAALSIGANVDINDTPGYAPLINDDNMIALCKDAAEIALPGIEFKAYDVYSSGSTDMGDLSCIMPVVHPYAAGASGTSHGNDYQISDPESACVSSAKLQLTMLSLLLKDKAVRAEKILSEFEPLFKSKKEYFAYVDELSRDGDRITYKDESSAEISL